ncbi:MAG TPA: transglutaminase-like domain-containing protein [Leptospiraceae bacterium]|nr:transglutaminase-like domain-containing protein [Leptospiraceae bacterium]HMW05407.1 transglutaminase-like domain-containing protein [Leptospiraceae bacterium]HMX35510.1 transglutaminase-like domain-containing protein [Leptospiraceae bacterium]HMY30917.1 transglutaminase-like domain-containing protein [Leptospiraceae bacterium]HMZ63328.1 transglutaminase-like domain-containing protein [Leptospiraceae bacterium]
MFSFDNSQEEFNFNGAHIERNFYELEFARPENKIEIISEIAKKIPWQTPIVDVIEKLNDPTLRLSSRNFIDEIHVERVNFCLKQIADKGHANHYLDLEKGIFLLSTIGDRTASYQKFKETLDKLAYRLNELFRLNDIILTDDVKVHLLSRVLYQEEGFNGNQVYYHEPDNSFVTKVLENKLGIPISLSVVYILVGMRLGLPLYGINLPLHFMLYYESNHYSTFVDPFNGGVLIDKDTCVRFLEANGYKDIPEYFSKASTLTILKRMYNNLINIYKKTGPEEMELLLQKQLGILENKTRFT